MSSSFSASFIKLVYHPNNGNSTERIIPLDGNISGTQSLQDHSLAPGTSHSNWPTLKPYASFQTLADFDSLNWLSPRGYQNMQTQNY
jgi:hypothetical protein